MRPFWIVANLPPFGREEGEKHQGTRIRWRGASSSLITSSAVQQARLPETSVLKAVEHRDGVE